MPANEKAPKPAPKKKSKAKTDIRLTELAARYLKHLDTEGKSNGTISSYGAELKLACKEIGPDVRIADLRTEQVAAFYDCKAVTKLRSGKKKSQLSIDKTRRVLRLALVFAAEKRWIASAPIPEAAKS